MIEEDMFSTIKPGDIVLIVNEWDDEGRCKENEDGNMDHWLGKIMTVKEHEPRTYAYEEPFLKMVEDQDEGIFGGGWFWNRYCVERILNKEPAIGIEELI